MMVSQLELVATLFVLGLRNFWNKPVDALKLHDTSSLNVDTVLNMHPVQNNTLIYPTYRRDSHNSRS